MRSSRIVGRSCPPGGGCRWLDRVLPGLDRPAGGRDGRIKGAAEDGHLDGWVVRGWRVGMRLGGLGGAGGGDYAVPSVTAQWNRDPGEAWMEDGGGLRGVMRWCRDLALAVSRRGAAVGGRSGGCSLDARSRCLTESGDDEVPPAGRAGGAAGIGPSGYLGSCYLIVSFRV